MHLTCLQDDLSRAFSVIDDARVVLEASGPTRFAVIRPLGADNFVHILAPMVTPRLR
ncbi:MAG: hypothetical protein JXA89_19435 [Anaerolineae bacterium]|nr:hypothetical protein [Anaerolineae bacterium]